MLYEFKCEECNEVVERYCNDYKQGTIHCPKCGRFARKILSVISNRNKQWAKECRGVK